MKKPPAGPSLFDADDAAKTAAVSVAPIRALASAYGIDLGPAPAGVPDRSRWRYGGDVVEVRGSSRVTVWYVVVGDGDDRQRAVFRADFQEEAVRL